MEALAQYENDLANYHHNIAVWNSMSSAEQAAATGLTCTYRADLCLCCTRFREEVFMLSPSANELVSNQFETTEWITP
jgi:predicted Fe-S protein YdhL (DUF1289 family)